MGRALRLLCIVAVSGFAGYLIGNFTPEAVTPNPPSASGLIVANLSIQPEEVKPDELVNITVSVINTRDTWGLYSLVLYINDVKETEWQVMAGPSSTQNITFSVTRQEPGSYFVFINGLSSDFTVVAP